MIPMQVGALEQNIGNHAEDSQRDALLDDLELNEAKGTSVLHKAQSVGWYLTTILKEGNHP